MGVFKRADSPWLWLYLETAPANRRKVKTAFKVGLTKTQQRDNWLKAEQVYHERMRTLASDRHGLPAAKPAITFRLYAERYARDILSHQRGYARALELLARLLDGFGDLDLREIDREHVQAWITTRRQTVSARTVNREVDLLKAMIRDAAPKYLEASPLAGMRLLPTVAPKRRLMSPDEETKILSVLKPDMRAILLIALDSLVRLSDVLDLRRQDDEGATLYIRDAKSPRSGRAYRVPMSTRTRAAIDALPKTDDPYLFPHRRRGRTEHARRANVRAALKAACGKVGVPYGRTVGGVTFHWATRRTGATRMLQHHAELKAVQKVGNWTRPTVMLEIYAETTSQAEREAVELVHRSQSVPDTGESVRKL